MTGRRMHHMSWNPWGCCTPLPGPVKMSLAETGKLGYQLGLAPHVGCICELLTSHL